MRLSNPWWVALVAAPAFAQPSQPPVSRGELLATTCYACHAESGGKSGKIPGMGKKTNHIIEEMNEFRSGEHKGTIMGPIARGYTEEEIRLMAQYLGAGVRKQKR